MSTDARLAEVVEEYLAEVEAGRAPDRDAFLAGHEDLGDALSKILLGLDFVRRGTRSVASEAPDAAGAPPQALGDYRLVREIGRGGMAVVYEAEQVSLGRRVALKILPFAAVLDPRQLQRFKNEALAAAHLEHKSIVPVYGVGCERGVHYYAMKYVEGQSLATAIRDLKGGGTGEGPKTPISSHSSNRELGYIRMAAALGMQAAEALDHAHQLGIVHRDVKPGNLLVDEAGKLWITDFGLARWVNDAGLTMTGEILGTIRYMSPEQALAKRAPVDHRTDVYSLGATLYELFTLEPAFPGNDPHRVIQDIAAREPVPPRGLNPALPRDLETVLLKAMSKEPASRYATAQEMADDLGRYLEDRAVVARRPSLPSRAARWSRRHRGVVAASSVMLLLGVAALVADHYRVAHERDQARANLRLARSAVDRFLVEFGVTDLEDAPRPRQARLALLEDALEFYRIHLVSESREDPAALRNFGAILHAMHRYQEALAAYERRCRLLSTDAAAHAERGHMLWHLGRLEEALAAFEQAVAIDPCFVSAYVYRGLALRDLGRDEAEVTAYREAIRLRPDLAWAHCQLGVALMLRVPSAQLPARLERRFPRRASATPSNRPARPADLEAAIEALREAIRLQPDYAEAHVGLGSALLAKGDPHAAIRALRDAIRVGPSGAVAHNWLGVALLKTGDADEAIQEFREAIRLDPDNAVAHSNLGTELARKGDRAGELQEFREAVRLDPNGAFSHYNLGLSLLDSGDPDGAVLELREAVRLQPDLAAAHGVLGEALARQGDTAGAIAEFREAVRLGPVAHGHYRLGELLFDSGDPDGAVREWREAVRLDPGNARYRSRLGGLLHARGDPDSAVRELREALRLDPNDAVVHYNLGMALRAAGDPSGAIREYREAIRIRPDYADAHCNLGNVLRDANDLAGAIIEYREAVRLKPELANAHHQLGIALHANGDPAGAIREYREAIRLKKNWAQAHYSLGIVLETTGEIDAAIEEYGEAIRLQPDYAEAYCNRGQVLKRLGRFQEALESLRTGHELGSKRAGWAYPSGKWLEHAERMAEMEHRMDRVLSGEARPEDALERTQFGRILHQKRRHAEAARMWRDAFAEDASLADDLVEGHRYNAACAAALAAARGGDDASEWRAQALGWLRADLAAREKEKAGLVAALEHWKGDADLAHVRDRLDDLPQPEREAWRDLWASVDQALATGASAPK